MTKGMYAWAPRRYTRGVMPAVSSVARFIPRRKCEERRERATQSPATSTHQAPRLNTAIKRVRMEREG